MFRLSTLVLMMASFFLVSNPVVAQSSGDAIGVVSKLQNSAFAVRGQQRATLQESGAIYKNDEIETGADARIEITFKDETKLTIGENSRLVIDEYLYDPDKDVGTLLLDAAKGPFRFISGGIGKLKDKRVEVQTTSATVGIRGTEFWGGEALGIYGILLLDGTIIVRNSAGARIVDVPGTGVNLTSPDQAPGEAAPWGEDRVQAALASITFR
ncbi:MAG: FecR domain-containing protein [Proteobacteria bacterium]|nr:FecR domain-containing protein [Pseudomonadota bacterium]